MKERGVILGFFDKIISSFATPDAVVPLSTNGTANYIYLAAEGSRLELNLHREVIKFIAKEFTKGKLVIKDVPNSQRIDYLLNLKPNDNQTANQMMYEFAFGLLKFGKVYYKIYYAPNAKAPTSIEIQSMMPDKPGFKEFEYRQLRLMNPTVLLDQYTDLINTLSTKQSANVLEINTALKANDVRRENESPESQSLDFQNKSNPRLTAINNQVKRYGAFVTNTNEQATSHTGLTNPDGTALEDLRRLIYEQFHINPDMLNGSYTEETYRSFYASQLRPLFNAFEELLNAELIDYNSYTTGAQIKVILDLIQFATLESFTNYAKESAYIGLSKIDELRADVGKEAYEDNLGQLIFSNKNSVALNNDDINEKLATKGTTTNATNSQATSG